MTSRLHQAAGLAAFLGWLTAYTLPLSAQTSAFTYQGQLTDGATAANGLYDFRFVVHDAGTNGNVVAGPITNAAALVSNGVFTTTLDFGSAAFNGADRWLELAVRTNTSSAAFQPLNPRQRITATPYALRAAQFSGAVVDSQLPSNVARLNSNQTFSGSVNFSNVTGSFSGNAAGLTNLNAANLTGTVADARLSTNVALLNRSSQNFSGTNNFNGPVGLGLTAPKGDLEIYNGSQAGPLLRLTGRGGAGAKVNLDLATYDPGTNAPSARLQADDDFYSSHIDFLLKQPGQMTNGLIPRMRIHSSGNVGIGTTNPDRPLTIAGANPAAQWISFQGTNATTTWHLNSLNNGFNIAQSAIADARFFIATNGNVGIGTATPSSPLTVQGQIRMGANTNLIASGGTEALRTVRGIITGSGTIYNGSGYTVTRTGNGSYTVNFNPAFGDVPAVIISSLGTPSGVSVITFQNPGYFEFHFVDVNNNPTQPPWFNFIAVGAP